MSTSKQAFEIANRHARESVDEGAVAVVVGVMMPDGRFFVSHSRDAKKTTTEALDCIGQAVIEEMADGWQAAVFHGAHP